MTRWSSKPQLLNVLCLGVVSVVSCWHSHEVAAKPGWGNCTGCHGPALSTTPADGSTLQFGDALIGESVDRTLRITNTGDNDGGRSVRLSGDFPASAGHFILDGETHFSRLRRNSNTSRTYSYTPTNRGTDSQDMTATADESSDGYPVIEGRSTVTFIGRGVAPVAEVDSAASNAGQVRIGTTAASQIMVRNLGDGNLSNRGAISNLRGEVTAATGAFTGPAGTIDLPDDASTTFAYDFTPTTHGPQSSPIGLTFSNGSFDGTNQAHTVSVELLGSGVGPEFDSSPAPGSMIDFGEVTTGQTALQSLVVENVSPDGNLVDLTNLTLLSLQLSGPGSDAFSVSSFTPGTVLSVSEMLSFDLLFAPEEMRDDYQATLTLTTDQDNILGLPGQEYLFQLAGTTTSSLRGDFNSDGRLNVVDIDLLTAEVIAVTHNLFYDLNGDDLVDQADRQMWAKDLKGTWFGDANLNGVFDSTDMVEVFVAGKYETEADASWSEGDWDGDGVFDSGDMVAAFVDGGYEIEAGPNAATVPEPSGWILLSLATLGLLTARGKRRPQRDARRTSVSGYHR